MKYKCPLQILLSELVRFVLFIDHVITIIFFCLSDMMDPSTPMGMLMENMEYLPDILPTMMTFMNSEEGVRFEGGGIWGWDLGVMVFSMKKG